MHIFVERESNSLWLLALTRQVIRKSLSTDCAATGPG